MTHQGSDVGEGVTMPLQIAPSWEAERPCAVAAAMGQPDLRRLLNVAHPLAVQVRGAHVEPVAIQNEPDINFVCFAVVA